MRLQDWAFVGAGAGLLAGAVMWALGDGTSAASEASISVIVGVTVTLWARRNPSPMPYSFRPILALTRVGTPHLNAAYLSAVLGEIPDRATALRELHRVMKPAGRLVIAEILLDPDYISLQRLKSEITRAGFLFERSTGTAFAYAARFRRTDTPIG